MVQRDQVPKDVMDRELWLLHVNALEDALLGPNPELHSFIPQTDEGFSNSEPVAAGEEATVQLIAPGGDKINGQAKSTGSYSLDIEWLDDNLEVVRREGIVSNREPNEWSNYSLDPKSPYVNIIVVNRENTEQTVDITAHYR